ncbi:MAG: hypothetical protein ACJAX3_002407 [Patiriisocius sp.]|jgi:hypothetical protein
MAHGRLLDYLLAFFLSCRYVLHQYCVPVSLSAVFVGLCVSVLLFFLKRWEFFLKQFLYALAKQALL